MNINCEIRETTQCDFKNLISLWNNGVVMYFVGFPDGLGSTLEEMDEWLKWAINKPNRCHYSIYTEEIGYCGETFYNVDVEYGTSCLDIKLLPVAQGKGIAKTALIFAINKAFNVGNA
jgi:RimJ/RimL family protein N-acetyltransferase